VGLLLQLAQIVNGLVYMLLMCEIRVFVALKGGILITPGECLVAAGVIFFCRFLHKL